jgi:hypothetical protein
MFCNCCVFRMLCTVLRLILQPASKDLSGASVSFTVKDWLTNFHHLRWEKTAIMNINILRQQSTWGELGQHSYRFLNVTLLCITYPPAAHQTLVYMYTVSDPLAPDDDCTVPARHGAFLLKIHHTHSCTQYYISAQMTLVSLECSEEFAPQLLTQRSSNQCICCYCDWELKI